MDEKYPVAFHIQDHGYGASCGHKSMLWLSALEKPENSDVAEHCRYKKWANTQQVWVHFRECTYLFDER